MAKAAAAAATRTPATAAAATAAAAVSSPKQQSNQAATQPEQKQKKTTTTTTTTTTFEPTLTFEALRKQQNDFAQERAWAQYHTPRNLLLALVGEVGELAELFQWRPDHECTPGLPKWSVHDKTHLGEELSDVLLYLIRLAEQSGVDLPNAALRKIQLNARKYPSDACKGSSAKYTEYLTSTTTPCAQPQHGKRKRSDAAKDDEGSVREKRQRTESKAQ
jgi:dCTP diphosphatase